MRELDLKNVIFTGRDQAEASPGWRHWAVISISEPDCPPVALQDGWHSVLRLEFHDIDALIETCTLFTSEQAVQIIQFVEASQESGEIEGILVHCRAGISRSAAVAKWIAERYTLPFPDDYMLYNKHVYRTLQKAAVDLERKEILELYSAKKIAASEAKSILGLDAYGLPDAMGRANLPLPRVSDEVANQMAKEVIDALGIEGKKYSAGELLVVKGAEDGN